MYFDSCFVFTVSECQLGILFYTSFTNLEYRWYYTYHVTPESFANSNAAVTSIVAAHCYRIQYLHKVSCVNMSSRLSGKRKGIQNVICIVQIYIYKYIFIGFTNKIIKSYVLSSHRVSILGSLIIVQHTEDKDPSLYRAAVDKSRFCESCNDMINGT